MAYLFVDKENRELCSNIKPIKIGESIFVGGYNVCVENMYAVNLPKGSIKKLIERELTWEDEPIEI